MLLDVIQRTRAGQLPGEIRFIREVIEDLLISIAEEIDLSQGLRAAIHQPLPTGDMRYVASYNISETQLSFLSENYNRLYWGDEPIGIAGIAATEQKAILIADLSKGYHPYKKYFVDAIPKRQSGGIVSVPILHQDSGDTQCLGILSVTTEKNGFLNEAHLAFISRYVEFISPLILHFTHLIEPYDNSDNLEHKLPTNATISLVESSATHMEQSRTFHETEVAKNWDTLFTMLQTLELSVEMGLSLLSVLANHLGVDISIQPLDAETQLVLEAVCDSIRNNPNSPRQDTTYESALHLFLKYGTHGVTFDQLRTLIPAGVNDKDAAVRRLVHHLNAKLAQSNRVINRSSIYTIEHLSSDS